MNATQLLQASLVTMALSASAAHAGVVFVDNSQEYANMGVAVATENLDMWGIDAVGLSDQGRILGGEKVAFTSPQGVMLAKYEGTAHNMVVAVAGSTLNAFPTRELYNMMGMMAGNYGGGAGYANLTVETSAGGSYSFSHWIDGGTANMSFLGLIATDGDIIKNVALTGDNSLAFKDFQVGTLNEVSPVPEPSTYALMGAGLAVLGFASRRRKANKA